MPVRSLRVALCALFCWLIASVGVVHAALAAAPAGFKQPRFDDSDFSMGDAPFGSRVLGEVRQPSRLVVPFAEEDQHPTPLMPVSGTAVTCTRRGSAQVLTATFHVDSTDDEGKISISQPPDEPASSKVSVNGEVVASTVWGPTGPEVVASDGLATAARRTLTATAGVFLRPEVAHEIGPCLLDPIVSAPTTVQFIGPRLCTLICRGLEVIYVTSCVGLAHLAGLGFFGEGVVGAYCEAVIRDDVDECRAACAGLGATDPTGPTGQLVAATSQAATAWGCGGRAGGTRL